MTSVESGFLIKARQSLIGAQSEIASGRYDNGANRAYYACFQAAIAALEWAGMRPPGRSDMWSHTYVQSAFVGILINRRKKFPAPLRGVLAKNQAIRDAADYQSDSVSPIQAIRAVERAEQFVSAIEHVLRKGSNT